MQDCDEDRSADAVRASRARTFVALAIAACVILWVLVEGMRVYSYLPDRIPLGFGVDSSGDVHLKQTLPKNPLTIYAMLAFGVFFMVAASLTARGPYPPHGGIRGGGSKVDIDRLIDRLMALPEPQREYAMAPVREGWREAGAVVAIATAMMQRALWQALITRQHWVTPIIIFMIGIAVALAFAAVGSVTFQRRARRLLETDAS